MITHQNNLYKVALEHKLRHTLKINFSNRELFSFIIDPGIQLTLFMILLKIQQTKQLSRITSTDTDLGAGMVGLAPKWVRLDPKLDKSGTFSDQISVHLAQ